MVMDGRGWYWIAFSMYCNVHMCGMSIKRCFAKAHRTGKKRQPIDGTCPEVRPTKGDTHIYIYIYIYICIYLCICVPSFLFWARDGDQSVFPAAPSFVSKHPGGVVLFGRSGVPVPISISENTTNFLVRSRFPGGPPPPPTSLQNRFDFWKGLQGRKSDILNGLDLQN